MRTALFIEEIRRLKNATKKEKGEATRQNIQKQILRVQRLCE
jgi:hypothetical protein